ncbi:MAG: ATP-binding protein [Thermoleophilia bacterium]
MYLRRNIQPQLEKALSRKKAVILYGARQVGKTTLVKKIIEDSSSRSLYLNCDEPDVRGSLTQKNSTELKQLVGDHALVVIDEAQRVLNIGLTLKLLIDNFPGVQVLATGSSSFELSNRIKEPLTGRKIEFHLFPLSVTEMLQDHAEIEITRLLESFLRFGMYPEVVTSPFSETAQVINEIAESYLYKDILDYQTLKKPELLEKLLTALALQIGQEVSYTELANRLGVDKFTVEKYISLLEKTFIIFPLRPYSRNLRKEIGKKRKIYFYDQGIRNSIIKNFNSLDVRNDIGALWESFLMAERVKSHSAGSRSVNQHFWRTYDMKEIDLVEESGGTLTGYEFKWGKGKLKQQREFLKTYPGSSIHLINQENFLDFVK